MEKTRDYRPKIRPISHISLTITDREAHGAAIRESVAWLVRRSGGHVPNGAFEGQSFDLSDQPTANPAEAVSIKEGAAQVWAARLSFPDKTVAQRNWITEIAVKTERGITTFSSRLTNVTRGNDAKFVHTVPGIALQILAKLSVEVDGESIADEARQISDSYELNQFCELVLRNNRRLPVILISKDDDGYSLAQPENVVRRLAGAVHVFTIDSAMAWRLTEEWGRHWSVFNGAVRIYWPNLDIENDNPRRHTLILPDHNPDGAESINFLSNLILPKTFEVRDAAFGEIRYEAIRAIYTASLRKAPRGSDQRLLELEQEISRLRQQLTDDESAANELLNEAARSRELAERDRDAAWAEAGRLRARAASLEVALKSGVNLVDEPLGSYQSIEEWCAKHLAGYVVFLPRAIREARKKGAREVIDEFSRALLFLRDYYVPMRRLSGSGSQRAAFDEKCREMGLEESACFSNSADARNYPGYYVLYKGRDALMDRHLKYGQGYDLRRMFRIYFFWDEEDEVVVVGHMPTHLDNNNTN